MKRLVCLILLISVLAGRAWALDLSGLREALPQEAATDGLQPDAVDVRQSTASLGTRLLREVRVWLRSSAAECLSILAIGAVTGLASLFVPALSADMLKRTADMTAVAAASAVCIGSAGGVLGACSASIEHLRYFSAALIPVYAASVAASGSPMAAAATSTATLLFSNALIWLASRLMIPLLHVHILMLAAGLLAENRLLLGASELFRKGTLAFFRYFLMLYTGYITMSGLIASGSDAVAVRTAKAAISGSVPMLGSVISDVSEALLSGAMLLRHTVGVFGFLSALAICLTPFAAAGARMLVFRLTSLVASSLCGGALSKLLDGVAEGYRVALGLLGTCCAIQFLSFVICAAVIRP